MSEDKTSPPTRKDLRNRRLEEQLRDNLRKRKELTRARKTSLPETGGAGGAPQVPCSDDE